MVRKSSLRIWGESTPTLAVLTRGSGEWIVIFSQDREPGIAPQVWRGLRKAQICRWLGERRRDCGTNVTISGSKYLQGTWRSRSDRALPFRGSSAKVASAARER